MKTLFGVEEAPPPKPRSRRMAPKSGKLNVVGLWISAYKAERQRPYVVVSPRDWNAVNALQKAFDDPEQLKRIFAAYLGDGDAFLNKNGWPLYLLLDRLNKYTAAAVQSADPEDSLEEGGDALR